MARFLIRHLPPQTAGTIAALLALREQVIEPILAGVRSPRMGRKPVSWTRIDRDYEKIRIDMQTFFHDFGTPPAPPHRQQIVDRDLVSA